MPYKREGRTVLQQRDDGKWVPVEGGKHESTRRAEAHLQALELNVGHGKKVPTRSANPGKKKMKVAY